MTSWDQDTWIPNGEPRRELPQCIGNGRVRYRHSAGQIGSHESGGEVIRFKRQRPEIIEHGMDGRCQSVDIIFMGVTFSDTSQGDSVVDQKNYVMILDET